MVMNFKLWLIVTTMTLLSGLLIYGALYTLKYGLIRSVILGCMKGFTKKRIEMIVWSIIFSALTGFTGGYFLYLTWTVKWLV